MHVHTPYGTIYREGDREWFAGSREQFETAKAWEMRMESNISAGDTWIKAGGLKEAATEPGDILTICGLDNPDDVGQSEYRAIYDTLRDALESWDGKDSIVEKAEHCLVMLNEFIEHAKAMRVEITKNVTKRGPVHTQDAQCDVDPETNLERGQL